MPPYSFIFTGRLFDMVLPKPVLDICCKGAVGDCAQFHFVSSMDSVYKEPPKPNLTVTTLKDGSWNITNKKDLQGSVDLNVKHVYIIVNQEADSETAPETELTESTAENPPEPRTNPIEITPSTAMPSAATTEIPRDVQEEAMDQDPDADNPEEIAVSALEQLNAADHDYVNTMDNEDYDTSEDEESGAKEANESTESEDKQRIACSICPSTCKDNWNLLKHIKRYHQDHPSYWGLVAEIKPLLRVDCDKCGKIFGNPKVLLEHKQKVHHTSYGAICNHCGKFFKTEHHMRLHVKYLHLRQPGVFLCELCPAKFNTKNVLREHVKYSHSNVDRSNKCSECDFVYAFKKQYYEHFTRVHGPKKHTCPYCDYKCATKWYMKKHTKNCAPKTSQMGMARVRSGGGDHGVKIRSAAPKVDLGHILQQVEEHEQAAESVQNTGQHGEEWQTVMVEDSGQSQETGDYHDQAQRTEYQTIEMVPVNNTNNESGNVIIQPQHAKGDHEETVIYQTDISEETVADGGQTTVYETHDGSQVDQTHVVVCQPQEVSIASEPNAELPVIYETAGGNTHVRNVKPGTDQSVIYQTVSDAAHDLSIKEEICQTQTVESVEVDGEKRQRVALTAADGTEHLIELILPK